MNVVTLVILIISYAVWYTMGRSAGRAQERKQAMPYVLLALPVFQALRVDGATRVTVTVVRNDDDTWTASQKTITSKEE